VKYIKNYVAGRHSLGKIIDPDILDLFPREVMSAMLLNGKKYARINKYP
jgi:hypothetical protein